MKKSLIVVSIASIVVLSAAAILMFRPLISKKGGKEAPAPAKTARRAKPIPAKRPISKDKGVLTVKIVDSKKKEMYFRIKAFRALDHRSSISEAAFVANRPYELPPGNYDLEIDTTPPKIYKNVTVAKGRERMENLGAITGAINIKALDAKRRDARYPVNILNSKSKAIIMAGMTNRPFELMPGIYDIDIATLPHQIKKDVKVKAGSETFIDLGFNIGGILVKAVDEAGKDARYNARLLKSETNEQVAYISTNRPAEVLEGTYSVELASTPRQTKKDVKVSAGQETVVEFTVQAPPPSPAKAKK